MPGNVAFTGESSPVKAGVRGTARPGMDGQGPQTPGLFPNNSFAVIETRRAETRSKAPSRSDESAISVKLEDL